MRLETTTVVRIAALLPAVQGWADSLHQTTQISPHLSPSGPSCRGRWLLWKQKHIPNGCYGNKKLILKCKHTLSLLPTWRFAFGQILLMTGCYKRTEVVTKSKVGRHKIYCQLSIPERTWRGRDDWRLVPPSERSRHTGVKRCRGRTPIAHPSQSSPEVHHISMQWGKTQRTYWLKATG